MNKTILGIMSLLLTGCGGPSAQLQAAQDCSTDIAQYCRGSANGNAQIAQCLFQNQSQLSPGCKAQVQAKVSSLAASGQTVSIPPELKTQAVQACKKDAMTFCGGQTSKQQFMICLYSHRQDVSAPCAQVIDQVVQLIMKQRGG